MENKYLIICLRHGFWNRYENIVFWGKNSSGYESDLSKVGLYTKEEAIRKCDVGDCYISVEKLGITADLLNSIHPNFEIKVKKTDDICKYVNQFAKIMKNKRLMKYGY